MACEKYRRWVSDELDGELSSKKATRLASHLRQCSSCRIYQQKLLYLQQEAAGLRQPSLPPGYGEKFSLQLMAKLKEEKRGKTLRLFAGISWRYAWVSGAVLLVVSLSLAIFFFIRPGQKIREESFISFEKFLNGVFQEIGSDDRLAEFLNLAVVEMMGEEIEAGGLGLKFDFSEDYLFVETLTEEEADLINRIIEEEAKLKGG